MIFETNYSKIIDKIEAIDPIRYGYTRNYLDGAVSRLSPYISRGVITTRMVFESLLNRGFQPVEIEKFVQELAWRDYWQIQWKSADKQLRANNAQQQEKNGTPVAILQHQTGIEAIDEGIRQLYASGYMHNHVRMYVASLACNIAQCHWQNPAQWMYYYLWDADHASNSLSWQWVAGVNSKKKYFANQNNINQFCYSQQKNTFLDIGYEDFGSMSIPASLEEIKFFSAETPLPKTEKPLLEPEKETLVYNFYQLDPLWKKEVRANRILLLEPSVFAKYPVSGNSLDFCIRLAQENIPGIQVWVAEFSELKAVIKGKMHFKEHPLYSYEGIAEARTFMSTLQGDFPSFFAFWKKAKKELF
jgi:deoxyribodipyrimidine photo-lyase